MYLKSLEINGFKSFSEKTVLTFLPPRQGLQSITAIVGPNGSGKSNIADAIRWVLGEQSMKLLRGKKSEDIIFAGASGKGRMSLGSVTLTIDNHDGSLPVPHEEFVVGRRAYRTGENEYVINGHAVRLLDVQLLLARAQFGQGSYSVIGQGMIDQILLQTSAERKEMFDEAFGIKEFQIKRHQAMLRLTRTKENITQAEALLSEVSPRLKTLSRQVKKLTERQAVETDLREYQETYYLTLWRHNQAQLKVLQAELRQLDAGCEVAQKRLAASQAELAAFAKAAPRALAYRELATAYQDLLQKKNFLERDRAALEGRLQVEYSKAGKHNVGWLESKIVALKDEQRRRQEELTAAESAAVKLTKDRGEKAAEAENLSVSRAELRGRLSSLQSALNQAKSEQNFLQMTGLTAVQAILESGDRFGEIAGAVAQLAEVDERYQLALDVAAGSHLSSLVVGNDRVAQAGIQYLREAQLGVATFLPLSTIKSRPVPQDIAELRTRPGVHGLALNLARFDRRFEAIFSHVFGSTIVVDNLDTARSIGIGRVRMVTLDGDLLETSGSLKGGYRRRRTSGLSFARHRPPQLSEAMVAEQEEKIRAGERELEETEMLLDHAQAALRELETSLALEKKKSQLLNEGKQAVDRELSTLEQERSLISMSKEEYGAVMDEIMKQKETAEGRIEAIANEVKKAGERLEQFQEEEEAKRARVFALQEAMQAEQSALNALTRERGDKQIAAARLETKQEDLGNEAYQELRATVESIQARRSETAPMAELEVVQVGIQKLKYQLTLIGGIDEVVVGEYEETKTRHDNLSGQIEDLRQALNDLEDLVVELDGIMRTRRAAGFKEIQREFRRYFALLFEGGKADLAEVYGEEKWKLATALGGVPRQRRGKIRNWGYWHPTSC